MPSTSTSAYVAKPPEDPKKSKGRPAAKTELSSKLGNNGKLTLEERKRHFDGNLCMFCGLSGHMVKDCPKSSSRASKACVAQIAPASAPPVEPKN